MDTINELATTNVFQSIKTTIDEARNKAKQTINHIMTEYRTTYCRGRTKRK